MYKQKSGKATPNMDLAHIEEKISTNKKKK